MPRPSTIRLAALGRAIAVNPLLALARPEILAIKAVLARGVAALAHATARQRGAMAAGGRCHRRRPQSLSRAAARGADRTAGRAVRGAGELACSRPTAAMRRSICCRGSICAPAPMRSCSARRPSECIRWPRSCKGAAVIEVPLERAHAWSLDPERLLAAWQPQVKIVYLCSPNNPTGNLLDIGAMETVCRRARRQSRSW